MYIYICIYVKSNQHLVREDDISTVVLCQARIQIKRSLARMTKMYNPYTPDFRQYHGREPPERPPKPFRLPDKFWEPSPLQVAFFDGFYMILLIFNRLSVDFHPCSVDFRWPFTGFRVDLPPISDRFKGEHSSTPPGAAGAGAHHLPGPGHHPALPGGQRLHPAEAHHDAVAEEAAGAGHGGH